MFLLSLELCKPVLETVCAPEMESLGEKKKVKVLRRENTLHKTEMEVFVNKLG